MKSEYKKVFKEILFNERYKIGALNFSILMLVISFIMHIVGYFFNEYLYGLSISQLTVFTATTIGLLGLRITIIIFEEEKEE